MKKRAEAEKERKKERKKERANEGTRLLPDQTPRSPVDGEDAEEGGGDSEELEVDLVGVEQIIDCLHRHQQFLWLG